jgi:hypothetical protein
MAESGAVKVSFDFVINGRQERFDNEFSVPATQYNDGPHHLAIEMFADVQKELLFGYYWDKLDDPTDLSNHQKREYSIESQSTGEYLFFENTQAVWFEIHNNLLEAKYLLAQARAYKEVELQIIKENNFSADDARHSHRVINIHLNKLDAFDRGVYLLARVEDLFLLMLFVNLGNSLVENVDVEKADWQKKIIWKAVKAGLKSRSSNPYLTALADEEYKEILGAMGSLKSIGEVKDIIDYRDSTTHRIRPSVDYPGFSAQLTFPKIRDGGNVIQMLIPALSSSHVDHQFLELYEKATKVYAHFLEVLRTLKRIPRFD